MPRMYKPSPGSDVRRAARLVMAVLSLSACGQQDGIIGAQPAVGGATGTGGVAGAAGMAGAAGVAPTPTYRTDFDATEAGWQSQTPLTNARTSFGVPIAGAGAPITAEVRLPGHPEYAATAKVGARFATQIGSARVFGFGRFRTRLRFGVCRPNEDAVNAALGYFSDGGDENQNGLTDDEEIDFQVLCGTPHRVFLTVFTDYQVADSGAEQFLKLSRVIDFGTGEVFDTPAPDQDAFTKQPTVPGFVHPELFASDGLYVVGFEWHATSLRFFLEVDGAEQTLWTLSDPARIPQHPVTFLYNVWHPDTHWYPATGAAAYPAQDVVMRPDWFEFYEE